MKKNLICKEKSGSVTKVKLVSKIKKLIQLYFGTLVLVSHCYCGDNAQNTDFFQNTGFKESSSMAIQKSQSNDKLSRKVMASTYHIE